MSATKEKAASPCQGEAALQTNLSRNNTPIDLLQGWLALAANAKANQQKCMSKRIWKRGRK